jgi:hypothetical protein
LLDAYKRSRLQVDSESELSDSSDGDSDFTEVDVGSSACTESCAADPRPIALDAPETSDQGADAIVRPLAEPTKSADSGRKILAAAAEGHDRLLHAVARAVCQPVSIPEDSASQMINVKSIRNLDSESPTESKENADFSATGAAGDCFLFGVKGYRIDGCSHSRYPMAGKFQGCPHYKRGAINRALAMKSAREMAIGRQPAFWMVPILVLYFLPNIPSRFFPPLFLTLSIPPLFALRRQISDRQVPVVEVLSTASALPLLGSLAHSYLPLESRALTRYPIILLVYHSIWFWNLALLILRRR